MPGRTAQSTLVGRSRDLATLHDLLARAQSGHGSLVLIGGPAGIGKTAPQWKLGEHLHQVVALTHPRGGFLFTRWQGV